MDDLGFGMMWNCHNSPEIESRVFQNETYLYIVGLYSGMAMNGLAAHEETSGNAQKTRVEFSR